MTGHNACSCASTTNVVSMNDETHHCTSGPPLIPFSPDFLRTPYSWWFSLYTCCISFSACHRTVHGHCIYQDNVAVADSGNRWRSNMQFTSYRSDHIVTAAHFTIFTFRHFQTLTFSHHHSPQYPTHAGVSRHAESPAYSKSLEHRTNCCPLWTISTLTFQNYTDPPLTDLLPERGVMLRHRLLVGCSWTESVRFHLLIITVDAQFIHPNRSLLKLADHTGFLARCNGFRQPRYIHPRRHDGYRSSLYRSQYLVMAWRCLYFCVKCCSAISLNWRSSGLSATSAIHCSSSWLTWANNWHWHYQDSIFHPASLIFNLAMTPFSFH